MKNKSAFFFFLVLVSFSLSAQEDSLKYTDLKRYFVGGSNANVNNYFKVNTFIELQRGQWGFESGIGINTFGSENVYFDGFLLASSYLFIMQGQRLKTSAMYVWNPYFKEKIHEHNFALKLTYVLPHFDLELGAHGRVLHPYKTQSYPVNSLAEMNFIYNFTAYMLNRNNRYNIYLSMTNIEPFQLERFSTPSFVLGFRYSKNVFTFLVEARYTPIGLTNIHVNYYDFQLRGGLLWRI